MVGDCQLKSAHIGSMDLTLIKEERSRSLEHRCDIIGADPVPTRLLADRTFVPADLLIWWQLEEREGADPEEKLHSYAWPAERESMVFADWREEAKMPGWIQERSRAVRRDLLANTATHAPGIKARWAYGLDRHWAVEGAEALPPNLSGESIVPAELHIWWSFNAGLSEREHRYSIYAWSASRDGRQSNRTCTQYGSSRAAFTYGSEDLPDWIRDLAEAQYVELEATAAAHIAERKAS